MIKAIFIFLSTIVVISCASNIYNRAAPEGNDTFKNVCSACHTSGLRGWLSGAPEIGDKKAWADYIADDSLAKMKTIVLKGQRDHRKKGGCKSCTDEQIIGAVEYMVSKSK